MWPAKSDVKITSHTAPDMSAPQQSRPRGTRGRVWNIFVSISLSFACLACYTLLVILYIRPGLYNIPSLVNVGSPSSWSLKPAVAVGLITALLVAATSALVSRSVEHSLWLKIVPRPIQKPLTAGETTRLAMWSVSPLARLTYTISGASWLLKIGGILLLAITIVSPVLLAGISQTDHFNVSIATTARAAESWTPWINRINTFSKGGSSTDLTFIMAAQASNGGFSPPIAPVCKDDSCSVSATSFALHATCNGQTQPNTVLAGIPTCGDLPEEDWVTNYCSDIMPSMCVNLTCGGPSTFAQFKTGTDRDCESDSSCVSNPGSWAVIFGAWVGGVETDLADKNIINTVSCLVEFGNITITQAGITPPQVNRSSFRRSKYPLLDYGGSISNVRTFIWGESPMRTPYYFNMRVVGTGWNDLFDMPLAHGLLGDDGSNSADVVARRIEDNFDWATLGAFSRQPNASNIVTTTREATRVYVYNRLVLLILLVPLLATLLGTWGRWTVGSDDDVLGYDPVAIATRGPVDGIASPAFVGSAEYRKACEKLRLLGYEESVVDPNTGHGGIHVRLRLLAEDES